MPVDHTYYVCTSVLQCSTRKIILLNHFRIHEQVPNKSLYLGSKFLIRPQTIMLLICTLESKSIAALTAFPSLIEAYVTN